MPDLFTRPFFLPFLKKFFLTACLLIACVSLSFAQALNVGNPDMKQAKQKKQQSEERITNFKVISQDTMSDGSIVKKVQFNKGMVTVRQTIISPPMPKLGYHKPINPDTMDHDSVMVYIDKRNYLVAVIYKRKRIRQYKAVFGPDRLPDKMQEGDRRTPEGWFKVVSKKYDPRWERFILLNYPNDTSYARFYRRKRKGLIPKNAKIGGSIGIHGTYPSGAGMVDIHLGWTDGCISLKPKDIEDLYRFVWPGTRVYIK